MQTPINSLLRRFIPAFAAIALLAIAAPTAAAAAAKTLPKNQQGTYALKSFVVIFKGQNVHAEVKKENIKIGPAGLSGGTKSVIISVLTNKANFDLIGLKISNIKSSLTSFSANGSGKGGSSAVITSSTVKATLSGTTLTITAKFSGTVKGAGTGSGTAVLIAKRTGK
jgi:hypothetical protein